MQKLSHNVYVKSYTVHVTGLENASLGGEHLAMADMSDQYEDGAAVEGPFPGKGLRRYACKLFRSIHGKRQSVMDTERKFCTAIVRTDTKWSIIGCKAQISPASSEG